MKIWNRFISFALATTLLLTVPLVSFAAGTKNSTSSDFTTVQSASGELLVRAYDLDNGDSVFEQYNDGKLVSRYTVDRSKNVINELVYSSDILRLHRVLLRYGEADCILLHVQICLERRS